MKALAKALLPALLLTIVSPDAFAQAPTYTTYSGTEGTVYVFADQGTEKDNIIYAVDVMADVYGDWPSPAGTGGGMDAEEFYQASAYFMANRSLSIANYGVTGYGICFGNMTNIDDNYYEVVKSRVIETWDAPNRMTAGWPPGSSYTTDCSNSNVCRDQLSLAEGGVQELLFQTRMFNISALEYECLEDPATNDQECRYQVDLSNLDNGSVTFQLDLNGQLPTETQSYESNGGGPGSYRPIDTGSNCTVTSAGNFTRTSTDADMEWVCAKIGTHTAECGLARMLTGAWSPGGSIVFNPPSTASVPQPYFNDPSLTQTPSYSKCSNMGGNEQGWPSIIMNLRGANWSGGVSYSDFSTALINAKSQVSAAADYPDLAPHISTDPTTNKRWHEVIYNTDGLGNRFKSGIQCFVPEYTPPPPGGGGG